MILNQILPNHEDAKGTNLLPPKRERERKSKQKKEKGKKEGKGKKKAKKKIPGGGIILSEIDSQVFPKIVNSNFVKKVFHLMWQIFFLNYYKRELVKVGPSFFSLKYIFPLVFSFEA